MQLYLLHSNEHLMHRILRLIPPLLGIGLHTLEMCGHYRIHQLILVRKILVEGLLTHPQPHGDLIHGNRADPTLHEQRLGKG